MLVAAMNPCKCGNYPDRNRCTCTQADIHRYLGKISRPLLDRIDICVEVPPLRYEDLSGKGKGEASSGIRSRVQGAQDRQEKRYRGTGLAFNAQLSASEIRRFCPLGAREEEFLKESFQK